MKPGRLSCMRTDYVAHEGATDADKIRQLERHNIPLSY
jgi:hypothetical protein